MHSARHAPSTARPARPLLHLPEKDWPEADRLRFHQAFSQPRDIFADDGGGAHLTPRTRIAIHYGYRRWLSWIAHHHPGLLGSDPGGRATPQLVRAFVDHLRMTCAERAVANQIRFLHCSLRYMCPDRDWSWLRDIKARLERAIPKIGRRPILTTSQRIVDASLECLDLIDAEYGECASTASRRHLQDQALRYRDGLLVAFAVFLPLRRKNLAELEIGATLRRGPAVWTVRIPGELVKNGEPYDADLPEWLSERVDHFIAVYRPLIHRSRTHKGLWASAKGRPATGQALYEAFQKTAAGLLNARLTLHDTRRIAATTWAVHDPANAAGAKDLLGDRSDRVFARHYNLASGIEASRAMAGIVRKLRLQDR
jgi:integrase